MSSAREAVQIHGGYGFVEDFPVARFYRDAKVLEIGGNTSEIQRVLIARALGLRAPSSSSAGAQAQIVLVVPTVEKAAEGVCNGAFERARLTALLGRPIGRAFPNGRKPSRCSSRAPPRPRGGGRHRALLTAFAQVAGAEPSTEEKLDAAKAEFERLTRRTTGAEPALDGGGRHRQTLGGGERPVGQITARTRDAVRAGRSAG